MKPANPSAIRSRPAGGPDPPPPSRRRRWSPRPWRAARRPRSRPPAAAGAATVAVDTAVDGGWPRVYDLPSGGSILLYQPQIATWDKQTHMVAFSAVSLRANGAEKPVLGSIKLEADTQVALDERLVNFQKLQITEANFKELAKERVAEIVGADRPRRSRPRIG